MPGVAAGGTIDCNADLYEAATSAVGAVNSGFCGGLDSIVSVRDALMRTGLEQAKNVVAGVAIRCGTFAVRIRREGLVRGRVDSGWVRRTNAEARSWALLR